MVKPTIGVYGPKAPDRAGGADFISLSLTALTDYFDCYYLSNHDWQHPCSFDHVLYHLGNNPYHSCAFEALKLRPGPAVIHEHNCLSYYLYQWRHSHLEKEDQVLMSNLLSHELGVRIAHYDEISSFLSEVGLGHECETNAMDIGIERLFIKDVTIAFSHSAYYQRLLRSRYPFLRIVHLPHVATQFDESASNEARRRIGIGTHDYLFGSYGFINNFKRLDKVFEAWKKWVTKPANVKLLIVGQNLSSVKIPRRSDLVYVDYVEDIGQFDALLGACDCAIQLRHPSVGETSGVMSKVIANGKLLITSDTEYLRTDFDSADTNIMYIRPDQYEVDSLIQTFQRVLSCHFSQRFDARYCPQVYARTLFHEIVGTNLT